MRITYAHCPKPPPAFIGRDAFAIDQPPKSEPWTDLLHDAAESVRLESRSQSAALVDRDQDTAVIAPPAGWMNGTPAM